MVNFKEMLKISFEAVLVNYCMITQRVQLYLEMTHPKLLKHFPRFEICYENVCFMLTATLNVKNRNESPIKLNWNVFDLAKVNISVQ